MNSIFFEPLNELFDDKEGTFDPNTIKHAVTTDVKISLLAGTPDSKVMIDFSPSDGSDIVIKSVDPEKALGYSQYADTQSYYENLSASLYAPDDNELLGGIDV